MFLLHDSAAQPTPAQSATWEYQLARKSYATTGLLWLTTGVLGGHRFYLGQPLTGLAMFATLGGLGIWAALDVLRWPRRIATHNRELASRIMLTHGAAPNTRHDVHDDAASLARATARRLRETIATARGRTPARAAAARARLTRRGQGSSDCRVH